MCGKTNYIGGSILCLRRIACKIAINIVIITDNRSSKASIRSSESNMVYQVGHDVYVDLARKAHLDAIILLQKLHSIRSKILELTENSNDGEILPEFDWLHTHYREELEKQCVISVVFAALAAEAYIAHLWVSISPICLLFV
jgi:hypothetical protein